MLNHRALKIIVMSTVFLLGIACLSFARTDHKEYRGAKLEDCRDCHGGSGVADNHGAFFMNEHKYLARKATSNPSASTATRAGASRPIFRRASRGEANTCRRRIGPISSPFIP